MNSFKGHHDYYICRSPVSDDSRFLGLQINRVKMQNVSLTPSSLFGSGEARIPVSGILRSDGALQGFNVNESHEILINLLR